MKRKKNISRKSDDKLKYTQKNLKRVSKAIVKNLTLDLLPKKMWKRNKEGGNNNKYGHCHTASGVIYKLFGPKNVHMYRAKDDEDLYHWWIVDKKGKVIDLTAEQYTLLGKQPPYKNGKKAGILGFAYKKRVNILLERVKQVLDIK